MQQRVHGATGTQVDGEADRGVHDEHGGDGRRFDVVTEAQGHESRRREKGDDHAGELVDEDAKGGNRRGPRQEIGTGLNEPPRGFNAAEALARRTKSFEHVVDGVGVPGGIAPSGYRGRHCCGYARTGATACERTW